MIGYIGIEEQVDKDFHRALLKASLHRWRERLGKRPVGDAECLLSYDGAKGSLKMWNQAYRGMRTVEVEKITGSVDRYRDFDASFLPKKLSMCERWSRIDRAYHRGDELPAVSLYKIGEAYFVLDGNHRVSVARYHGVVAIDAEVVEINGRAPADTAHRRGHQNSTPAHSRKSRIRGGAAPLHGLLRRLWPNGIEPDALPRQVGVMGG